MSEGEAFITLVSIAMGLALWPLWRALRAGRSLWRAGAAAWCQPLCAVLIGAVLSIGAASDVRSSTSYLFQYTVLGASWIGLGAALMPALGINPVVDAVMRRNGAASVLYVGASFAISLAYIGGNIGEGPGWPVVVFSSGLATLALLLFWLTLNVVTDSTASVSIDRSRADAYRLSGVLIAAAIVLGRAVAGDWHSAEDTVTDFIGAGWPAVLLIPAEWSLHRLFGPSPRRPVPPVRRAGIIPAVIYIVLALLYALFLGPPA